MLNAEYLLKSFATFATERGQTHVHTFFRGYRFGVGPGGLLTDLKHPFGDFII